MQKWFWFKKAVNVCDNYLFSFNNQNTSSVNISNHILHYLQKLTEPQGSIICFTIRRISFMIIIMSKLSYIPPHIFLIILIMSKSMLTMYKKKVSFVHSIFLVYFLLQTGTGTKQIQFYCTSQFFIKRWKFEFLSNKRSKKICFIFYHKHVS